MSIDLLTFLCLLNTGDKIMKKDSKDIGSGVAKYLKRLRRRLKINNRKKAGTPREGLPYHLASLMGPIKANGNSQNGWAYKGVARQPRYRSRYATEDKYVTARFAPKSEGLE